MLASNGHVTSRALILLDAEYGAKNSENNEARRQRPFGMSESGLMKKSRFSAEQIIGILREAGAGSTVRAVCAAHNIAEQTYYGWKRKYGGMEVDEARRLRGLEEENGRLKRLVADQAVQIQILKEVNAKKW